MIDIRKKQSQKKFFYLSNLLHFRRDSGKT